MPTPYDDPRADLLDKILRASSPNEKDGALQGITLPPFLQERIETEGIEHKRNFIRTQANLAAQLALRDALQKAHPQEEATIALLLVLLYYNPYVRIQNKQLPGELQNLGKAEDMLEHLGLSKEEVTRLKGIAKNAFPSVAEIHKKKALGLNLWWDALQKHSEAALQNTRDSKPWMNSPARIRPHTLMERADLGEKILLAALNRIDQPQKVLLLHGEPGVGKTTELTRLYYRSRIVERFGDHRVWLPGQAEESPAKWRRKLANLFDIPPKTPAEDLLPMLDALFKKRLSPWLFLLDNCASAAFVRELEDILPDGSLLVLTAQQRLEIFTHLPTSALLKIEKLEEMDAWQMFLLSHNREAHSTVTAREQKWVREMVAATQGNPLILKIAFGLKQDLKQIPPNRQLTFVLQAFDQAHADSPLGQAARLLGVLPPLAWAELACFESLWITLKTDTSETLRQLERAGLVDALANPQNTVYGWRVHESVRRFFAEGWGQERQAQLSLWRERYRIRSKRFEWMEQAQRALPPQGAWRNDSRREELLTHLEEQLGEPLSHKTSFWGLFGRAWQQLGITLALWSGKEPQQESFFSVQWRLLAGNSYLFSSVRYISAYALAQRMAKISLNSNSIGLILIFIAPLLPFLGITKGIPADWLLPLGFGVTFVFLALFRLLPHTPQFHAADALYNLLWQNPDQDL